MNQGRSDDGPYEQAPEQEEVAGLFDGMAQGRALMLRKLRTSLAPLGLTVTRRATLVAISDSEPIPETVGKPPDNPFQNPHYDFGYRCGLLAANQVFTPAARELLSHLAMTLADDGTVSLSARTSALATDFIAAGREIAAPPSINTPAADRILALFANREARAAFTAPKSSLSRRSLLIGTCATVLLALGATFLSLRSPSLSVPSGPAAQIATLIPVERWRGFSETRRERLHLIDQWIVDRYNFGAYSEVATVIQGLMGSIGNDATKDLANTHVNFSARWELARLLLPGLDPALSDENVRRSTLRVVYLAASESGAQFLSSVERSIVQNYMQSNIETDSVALVWGQKALSEMLRLGL